MPSQPPLPPLLLPYTSQIPPLSLTLITSVLGATSNWLVLRFLYATLNGTSTGSLPRENGSPSPSGNRVVLLSFLRNYDFWRGQAKRLVRVDFILELFIVFFLTRCGSRVLICNVFQSKDVSRLSMDCQNYSQYLLHHRRRRLNSQELRLSGQVRRYLSERRLQQDQCRGADLLPRQLSV
jgi:hypothetical protein